MITGPAFFFTTCLVLYCVNKFLKNNRIRIENLGIQGWKVYFEEKPDA
jgi:hypothetical protein